jgi:hypothetical protein
MRASRTAAAALAGGALAVVVALAVADGAPDTSKLPLGDGLYRTSPEVAHVFSCQTQFNGGGAFRDGPWIDNDSKTWDLSAKIAVRGNVKRNVKHSLRRSRGKERISGDGLPSRSGVFPVASSDPAYQYDRNPNSIRAYTLRVKLPANPKPASAPTCVGGTIGVAVNGIPIYSAFDAGGRDAAAHEVQDRCTGHPQMSGQYHYHSLSHCWKDRGPAGGPSSLFGYALDGFGIYGPRDQKGRTLGTADLDACHGTTSRVKWHGKYRRIYHYVATSDFPYLVSCYRGTPITSATGLGIGGPG